MFICLAWNVSLHSECTEVLSMVDCVLLYGRYGRYPGDFDFAIVSFQSCYRIFFNFMLSYCFSFASDHFKFATVSFQS